MCIKMANAQIKMGESIAVMIVFFIILMFGLTFYFNVQKTLILREKAKLNSLKALQVAQKASYMPEFQCSVKGVKYSDCFDINKVQAFYKKVNSSTDYLGYDYELGTSIVRLYEVYPGNATFTVYEYYVNQTKVGDVKSSRIPVLLYNYSSQLFSLGIMQIDYMEVIK